MDKFPITISFYNESSCSQSVPKAPHFDTHLYKHVMTWSLRKSIEEIYASLFIPKLFAETHWSCPTGPKTSLQVKPGAGWLIHNKLTTHLRALLCYVLGVHFVCSFIPPFETCDRAMKTFLGSVCYAFFGG